MLPALLLDNPLPTSALPDKAEAPVFGIDFHSLLAELRAATPSISGAESEDFKAAGADAHADPDQSECNDTTDVIWPTSGAPISVTPLAGFAEVLPASPTHTTPNDAPIAPPRTRLQSAIESRWSAPIPSQEGARALPAEPAATPESTPTPFAVDAPPPTVAASRLPLGNSLDTLRSPTPPQQDLPVQDGQARPQAPHPAQDQVLQLRVTPIQVEPTQNRGTPPPALVQTQDLAVRSGLPKPQGEKDTPTVRLISAPTLSPVSPEVTQKVQAREAPFEPVFLRAPEKPLPPVDTLSSGGEAISHQAPDRPQQDDGAGPTVISTGAPHALARADSPSATSPVAAIPGRDISRQIAEALPMQDSAGFDLALSPEELGHVRLRLSIVDGASLLSIHAERPETLDLIRRHIASLETELRAHGHDGLTLRFSGGDGGAQTATQDRSDSTRTRSPAEASIAEAMSDTPTPRLATRQDRLDLRL